MDPTGRGGGLGTVLGVYHAQVRTFYGQRYAFIEKQGGANLALKRIIAWEIWYCLKKGLVTVKRKISRAQ